MLFGRPLDGRESIPQCSCRKWPDTFGSVFYFLCCTDRDMVAINTFLLPIVAVGVVGGVLGALFFIHGGLNYYYGPYR